MNLGSRNPYPPDQPNYDIPSSKYDSWPYDSKYYLPDRDQSNVNTQEGEGCTATNTYRGYVPTGRTKVSYITIVDEEKVTTEQCMRECCDKGPEKCQYAWTFQGQCILIGCTQEDNGLCEPIKFLRQGLDSVYVEVSSDGSDISDTLSTGKQTTNNLHFY